MKDKIKQTSKLLSFLLRHQPEAAELTLDAEGWVNLETLIAKINEHYYAVDTTLIQTVVSINDKKRFVISDDGMRIRANQGHSIEVDLNLVPTVPPDILYHGTVEKFVKAIQCAGLQKMSRQHVHLSTERDTAAQVGSRRGKAIVLTIDARRMARDGYPFYQSKNGVWLTEHIPSCYIQFP